MGAVLDDPQVNTVASTKTHLYPQWNVLLLNDDVHSFPFVIHVIMQVFRKTVEEAFSFTLGIHQTGQAILTTCSKERAELYLEQVSTFKEGDKGALGCAMEPVE